MNDNITIIYPWNVQRHPGHPDQSVHNPHGGGGRTLGKLKVGPGKTKISVNMESPKAKAKGEAAVREGKKLQKKVTDMANDYEAALSISKTSDKGAVEAGRLARELQKTTDEAKRYAPELKAAARERGLALKDAMQGLPAEEIRRKLKIEGWHNKSSGQTVDAWVKGNFAIPKRRSDIMGADQVFNIHSGRIEGVKAGRDDRDAAMILDQLDQIGDVGKGRRFYDPGGEADFFRGVALRPDIEGVDAAFNAAR